MNIWKLLIGAFLAITSALSVASSAVAQGDGDFSALMRRYAAAGARAHHEILEKFTAVMTEPERKLLASIAFEFPPEWDVRIAVARIQDGRRKVTIGGGHLASMDAAADTMLVSNRFGKNELAMPYLDKLVSTARENMQRTTAGRPHLPMPEFQEFASIPSAQLGEFRSSAGYDRAKSALFVHGLAFVLAHEIGHHVLGHLGRPVQDAATRRRLEAEADEFAIRLVLRAGYSPIAALSMMSVFAAMEQDLFSPLAGHPAAVCRQATFILAGIGPLLNDPKFREVVSANPGGREQLDNFEKSIPMLRLAKKLCDSDPEKGLCGEVKLLTVAAEDNFEFFRGRRTDQGKELFHGTLRLEGTEWCQLDLGEKEADYYCGSKPDSRENIAVAAARIENMLKQCLKGRPFQADPDAKYPISTTWTVAKSTEVWFYYNKSSDGWRWSLSATRKK